MLASEPGDDQKSLLIDRPGWNLQQGWIQPQGLSGPEVDAVLATVRLAFGRVELKLHFDPKPIPF